MLDMVTAKEKKGSNANAVEVDDMEDLFPNRLKQHLKESYSHLLCPSALQALVIPKCSTNSRPISMSRSWNISIHFWAHCNIWKEMLIGSNSCLVLPYTCSVFQHLQPTLKGAKLKSLAKNILSAKRSRMKLDLFRKILFIRRNYHLLNIFKL